METSIDTLPDLDLSPDTLAQALRSLTVNLRSLIEQGADAHKVYEQVASLISSLPDIKGVATYLSDESRDGSISWRCEAQGGDAPELNASGDTIRQWPITCDAQAIGRLITETRRPLSMDTEEFVRECVHYLSVATERERLSSRIRHFNDRLEVLNEINQLIASKVGLQKTLKNLAREAAFRFSADCTLACMLSDEGTTLDIHGSYGCAPDATPASVALQDSLFGRALRLGGIFSVPELVIAQGHGMQWLVEMGIVSVHCCSLGAKGEILGAILLGFRKPVFLTDQEGAMFEEFARAAGVAVANAKSQERLRSYAEQLEDLVQQRTADLAVQTARAEEANKAKSRFVANISHELRTPLTAIIGYSSVLADGVFGSINDKQKDALTSITRSSEHLKELIDDVLDISRIESGKEDAKPSKIELAGLLQQIQKLMMQTALGKGVKLLPLEISEDAKTAQLWVDTRHIRQVLINLMSNAVKYTEPGGTVQLHASVVGDKAQIGVKDSGVGISAQQMEKLFERFNRGDDSYSRSQTGTGIGLSLTKRLIEINGGKIGVESEAGKGSHFWALIPLADVTSAAEELVDTSTNSNDLVDLTGLNVLIIDDNKMTCQFLGTLITRAGGTPQIAFDVPTAKALLNEQQFDAALVDLAMPGENGLDFIRHVRTECEGARQSLPLIVVSACAFKSDQEQALATGASTFIAKPFRPKEVLLAVRQFTTLTALESVGSFRIK